MSIATSYHSALCTMPRRQKCKNKCAALWDRSHQPQVRRHHGAVPWPEALLQSNRNLRRVSSAVSKRDAGPRACELASVRAHMNIGRLIILAISIFGSLLVLKNTSRVVAGTSNPLWFLLAAPMIYLTYRVFASLHQPKPVEKRVEIADVPCWHCGKQLLLGADTCPACMADQHVVEFKSTRSFSRVDLRDSFDQTCICCLGKTSRATRVNDEYDRFVVWAFHCSACRWRRNAIIARLLILMLAGFLGVIYVINAIHDHYQLHWAMETVIGIVILGIVGQLLERIEDFPELPVTDDWGEQFRKGAYFRATRFGNRIVAERLRHALASGQFSGSKPSVSSQESRPKRSANRRRVYLLVSMLLFAVWIAVALLNSNSVIGIRSDTREWLSSMGLHPPVDVLELMLTGPGVAVLELMLAGPGVAVLAYTMVALWRTRRTKSDPSTQASQRGASRPAKPSWTARVVLGLIGFLPLYFIVGALGAVWSHGLFLHGWAAAGGLAGFIATQPLVSAYAQLPKHPPGFLARLCAGFWAFIAFYTAIATLDVGWLTIRGFSVPWAFLAALAGVTLEQVLISVW